MVYDKFCNGIILNNKKIKYRFIHSSGPGGQHVNKVSTGVILEYDLMLEKYPCWFIDRIRKNLQSHQISNQNVIKIKSTKHKSQKMNRNEAKNKLILVFEECSNRKVKRRFKPLPIKQKELRLKLKKLNSHRKQMRKKPDIYE